MILAKILRNRDMSTEDARFTMVDGILVEGGPSKTHPFDAAGTSSASTPP